MVSSRSARLLAVLAAASLFMAACASDETSTSATATGTSSETGSASPEPLGGSITLSIWDLYMPKKLVKDFEAETGVDVEVSLHATNEDIMGKLQASNGTGYDLVFVSGPFVKPLVELGYAAQLDHAQVPNLANLYPQANELGYDTGNVYSAPYTWGTTGICYRTDLLDAAPTSWEAFRAPAPGTQQKMTMLGTDRWLLQPALLSLGYSVNTSDAAEIEEAKAWTLEAKENLLAFDDTTFYSKLASGEASLVHAWDGWCEYTKFDDPDVAVEFVIPDEGSDVWTDTMVVMESSENKAAAHAFIDFILDAGSGKSVVDYTLYKVPNQPAMESVEAETIETYPTLGITPEELFEQEALLDLGAEGTLLWTETATEIKAG
jgi:spermidine/putrescine transport system substrate-binding protein